MMEYIFYSVIGSHGGESVDKIIERKQKEMELCGFSLWSAHIDKMSIRQVWNLKKTDRVIVLCKISKNAKDPVGQNNIYHAKTMIGPIGESIIPNGIDTTFAKGKNYQAYVIKKYEILDFPINFDFEKYETRLSNGTTKSFKERFKCCQFQNTFGRKNDKLKESCKREISIIMELEYPFVVNIK